MSECKTVEASEPVEVLDESEFEDIVETITDWNQFQEEVGEWARENFGDDLNYPIMGIVEEVGEFQDVGACETPTKAALMRDAIGDVMVFMADFCSLTPSLNGWVNPLEQIMAEADHYQGRLQIDILSALGRMCHARLKEGQGIRGDECKHRMAMHRALVEIVCWAKANTDAINEVGARGTGGQIAKMEFGMIVANVWVKVSNRDWKANPEDGGEAPAREGCI